MNTSTVVALTFFTVIIMLPLQTTASEFEITTTIKNHRFNPSEIRVPAEKKIKLIVENQDDSKEEFDSQPLNREKVIAGHSKGVFFFGPLDPGTYSFVGEFNDKTAFGEVIAE